MAFKQRTVISGDYNDLEEIVMKHYGREWSLVADQEMGNDSTFEAKITKDEALDEYELEDIAEFKATGESQYLAPVIMQDLCNAGLLEPGEYTIRISW